MRALQTLLPVVFADFLDQCLRDPLGLRLDVIAVQDIDAPGTVKRRSIL